MKATLEFELPDDRVAHVQAVHAREAWAALENLAAQLRAQIKHGQLTKPERQRLEALRELVPWELLEVAT